MANATLTSANSVLLLSVTDLFTAGVRLQGYSTDDIFSSDVVTTIETAMGLDGLLSGGFVPAPRVVSITLQGNSLSNYVFEEWQANQEQAQDAFIATLLVELPAISRGYTCRKGMLTSYSSLPDGRRILQPRRYSITFEGITGAPL